MLFFISPSTASGNSRKLERTQQRRFYVTLCILLYFYLQANLKTRQNDLNTNKKWFSELIEARHVAVFQYHFQVFSIHFPAAPFGELVL